ncbi:PAS domain S-box protein [Variovorax sp. YR216]|uniref:PAS domain-containing hybrid sensor histidine kinase/response regulator n=1 Tax=Variovorax sp. YR216 TaxID=1882828 RepID=UPI00089BAEB1|nr:PAS domain S-box protein [Variovorax sp. YR216]SEB20273.1 PAS domain S-box-containing protein [Variovorax sp. YR216]
MKDPNTPPPPARPAMQIGDTDFRLMVEAVTDYAIFLLDPDGFIQTWNEGARILKGYERDEVLGRHFSIFYPPELLARKWPEHELEQALATGRFEDEGWRLRKDGTRFWASIVITRVMDERGALRGFSKITRDLSERRRQEELLRSSEERFRLLVEGVKDYAIFMLDPSGHIVSWNLGAQKNKGYEASEIIGKHFSVFYPPEVAARGWPEQELRLALRDGRMEDEGWRVRKDGSRFWASVVITALYDASGRHRGFAKVTRDLSERRRVSSLEDEGRRVATFLAMLGHELRNPLAPISNAMALLARGSSDTRIVEKVRDTVVRQLRQLTRLVDDLLDVSRITSGKIHLEAKPVRLRDAANQAVESVQPMFSARSQTLHLEAGADPWVIGDLARIVQIISNLLNNAAKFTPSGGHIGLRLAINGALAEITVSDDGPGIPIPDLKRVFDLFAQGQQDVARSQGGLGLGLSLVQQLVTLQGGMVSAFSSGRKGEGAEFLVQFPVTPAPATAIEGHQDDTRGRRILVVDDNRDSAETMQLLLEALGYEASVAYDGVAGLDAIKTQAPDVVLLDIGLPGLSGIEVAKRVRTEVHQQPTLIAVTGYGQESDRETSYDAGFFAHLTKPVALDQLQSLLDRVLPLEPPRAA